MEAAKKTCHQVAQEVLMTERAYVANLRNLHELYYKRLNIACYYPKDHPQRFIELDMVLVSSCKHRYPAPPAPAAKRNRFLPLLNRSSHT